MIKDLAVKMVKACEKTISQRFKKRIRKIEDCW